MVIVGAMLTPPEVSPGTPTTRDSTARRALARRPAPTPSPPPVSRTESGEEGLLEWIEANGASQHSGRDPRRRGRPRRPQAHHGAGLRGIASATSPMELKARRLRASLVELGRSIA